MAEHTGRRNGLIILAAVALAAIGGVAYLAAHRATPVPPAPPAAPQAAGQAAPAAPRAAPFGPQFDILRVDSSGDAVIAGHADPGATVTIKDGDKVIGTVTADATGSFALIPATPFAAGPHQLSLSESQANGPSLAGQTSATVDVAANPSGQSLAVISGPNGSKLVSGQGPVPGSLGIGTVDYDTQGHAIFSGTAHPGDHVVLSLNGGKIGVATAGADGTWRLLAATPSGNGMLSATDIDKPGAKSLTAPFVAETLATALAQGHVVIIPGQNLWLIARRVYGRGTLYTLIYQANATQIHDPNLIFPGQAFKIPSRQP